MTSQTSQQRLARARDRYHKQTLALAVLERAETALRAAEKKRADALAKLDTDVATAATRRAAALAHLAGVLRSDTEAADLAGVDLPDVRAARRQLSPEQAATHLAALTPRRRNMSGPTGAAADPPPEQQP